MSLSIGLIFGLATMVCWGIADFLQAIPTKRIGSKKTMFIGNALGILLNIVVFFFLLAKGMISFMPGDLLILAGVAVLQVLAFYFFLRSFEIGEISVVAPISASYSLVTVILAVIFLNESLGLVKAAAIGVIVLGIMLTSADIRKLKHLHAAKGVRESLVPLFSWGIAFFFIGLVAERMDYLNLFIFTGLFNSTLVLLFSGTTGGFPKKEDIMRKDLLWIFLVNVILYNLAWVSINYGISKGMVSIITPVSSLYPAITVILAGIFFKEKLVLNQKLGIIVVLIGLFLISL